MPIEHPPRRLLEQRGFDGVRLAPGRFAGLGITHDPVPERSPTVRLTGGEVGAVCAPDAVPGLLGCLLRHQNVQPSRKPIAAIGEVVHLARVTPQRPAFGQQSTQFHIPLEVTGSAAGLPHHEHVARREQGAQPGVLGSVFRRVPAGAAVVVAKHLGDWPSPPFALGAAFGFLLADRPAVGAVGRNTGVDDRPAGRVCAGSDL